MNKFGEIVNCVWNVDTNLINFNPIRCDVALTSYFITTEPIILHPLHHSTFCLYTFAYGVLGKQLIALHQMVRISRAHTTNTNTKRKICLHDDGKTQQQYSLSQKRKSLTTIKVEGCDSIQKIILEPLVEWEKRQNLPSNLKPQRRVLWEENLGKYFSRSQNFRSEFSGWFSFLTNTLSKKDNFSVSVNRKKKS